MKKDLTVEEVKKVLPLYMESTKVETKLLLYVSPELILVHGEMMPSFACSIDGKDEKTLYTNFLETLESNGYDRATKTFK